MSVPVSLAGLAQRMAMLEDKVATLVEIVDADGLLELVLKMRSLELAELRGRVSRLEEHVRTAAPRA